MGAYLKAFLFLFTFFIHSCASNKKEVKVINIDKANFKIGEGIEVSINKIGNRAAEAFSSDKPDEIVFYIPNDMKTKNGYTCNSVFFIYENKEIAGSYEAFLKEMTEALDEKNSKKIWSYYDRSQESFEKRKFTNKELNIYKEIFERKRCEYYEKGLNPSERDIRIRPEWEESIKL